MLKMQKARFTSKIPFSIEIRPDAGEEYNLLGAEYRQYGHIHKWKMWNGSEIVAKKSNNYYRLYINARFSNGQIDTLKINALDKRAGYDVIIKREDASLGFATREVRNSEECYSRYGPPSFLRKGSLNESKRCS